YESTGPLYRLCGRSNYFAIGGSGMTRGNTQRHATIAVVELSDVKRWLRAHQALVRAVAADGNITEDEVTTLTENIRRGSVEIDEAMLAAERADVAELIVLGNRKEHG